MKFKRIEQLTGEIDDLKSALRQSDLLELSGDQTSVRRRHSIDFSKDIDKCTIYVEHLPDETDHDWLNELFSQFGPVAHCSLPRFKDSKKQKGFAFVEFDDDRSALNACEFFSYLTMKKETVSVDESHDLFDKLLDNLTVNETVCIGGLASSLNDRKRPNDDANSENAKRIKSVDFSDQAEPDFKSLLQRFNAKYKEKIYQLIKLRVISKARWSAYKKEYLNLKRTFNNQTKKAQSTNTRTESEDDKMDTNQSDPNNGKSICKAKKAKTDTKFNMEPGLIIKLDYVKSKVPEEESLIKKELRKIDGDDKTIAYIDIKSDLCQCFIRFKDRQSATNYSLKDELTELGKVCILEGIEEESYWSTIMQSLLDRKKKKEKRSKDQNGDQHQNKKSESFTSYKKGLIIKLQMDIELSNGPTEQELKKKIKSCVNGSYIAYIDQDSPIHNLFLTSELIRKTIFIRCNSADCAAKVLESEQFKALGESSVLKDQDEFDYWQHVKECSQRKHPKKKCKKPNKST